MEFYDFNEMVKSDYFIHSTLYDITNSVLG